MTAPTHAAFGVLLAAAAQSSYGQAIACALGALLPDIDHPRSSVGRILFFVSAPLNAKFGHRGLVHSFIVWLIPCVIGLATGQPLLAWAAIGALSHCLIDCYTLSGVQAFLPFTDKSVVLFRRDWRIRTGSTQEIFLFMALFVGVSAMNYTYAIGGPRKLINILAKSPKIATEEFTRAGDAICYVRGKWRWSTGKIEEVEWLVVGSERQYMVFFDGNRILRRAEGEFLSSVLKQTDTSWNSIKVRGIVTVNTPSFFFDGRAWHFAKAGQKAIGTVRSVDNSTPDVSFTP